jgi:glucokinase
MVVETADEAIGSTLGLLINVLDPEAVIIGGGLGLTEGLYWQTLLTSTRRHIWSDVNRDLPITHAATGSRAGIIGAALAAWRQCARFKSD